MLVHPDLLDHRVQQVYLASMVELDLLVKWDRPVISVSLDRSDRPVRLDRLVSSEHPELLVLG